MPERSRRFDAIRETFGTLRRLGGVATGRVVLVPVSREMYDARIAPLVGNLPARSSPWEVVDDALKRAVLTVGDAGDLREKTGIDPELLNQWESPDTEALRSSS